MYQYLTNGTATALTNSLREAQQLGHNLVELEHILLGILLTEYSNGATILNSCDISAERIILALKFERDRGLKIEQENRRIFKFDFLKIFRNRFRNSTNSNNQLLTHKMSFSPRSFDVLRRAYHKTLDLKQQKVGTDHILLAIVEESNYSRSLSLLKNNLNIKIESFKELVQDYIKNSLLSNEDLLPENPEPKWSKWHQKVEQPRQFTPFLDAFAENLSMSAEEGELDPVIERDKEIESMVVVLGRRRKNNPILVGEPGVGKTAVVEGLAHFLLNQKVPDFLQNSTVMALDIYSVVAGTKYRGEFEERLKIIIEEILSKPPTILFLDEIHTLVGAGSGEGAIDAANLLKPMLARGKLRCIGATTPKEYKKYIERDTALERRFQRIYVNAPTVETTIKILQGLQLQFAHYHSLSYQDDAIKQAVILSNKYIADRQLPDKAIDTLDEAGALVKLENRYLPLMLKGLLYELQDTIQEKEYFLKFHNFIDAKILDEHEEEIRVQIQVVKRYQRISNEKLFARRDFDLITENDVATVISNWTGVPINKLSKSESSNLLKMEEKLKERIIGQKSAVTAVSNAMRRARANLRDPNRPIASFMFAGPTGVGKTELTKALSEYLFSDEKSMIRFDLSEYMERHTIAKLIGSPPGYVGYSEGGQLTEAVRKKPYTIILFDEVEKAHPDVFNLMLQILDDGRLTDSSGKLVNFNNTLIIMTTNLGAEIIKQISGIKNNEPKESDFRVCPDFENGWKPVIALKKNPEIATKIKDLVHNELSSFFRPEFLNRLDDIIVFEHLTKLEIWEICGLMLKQIEKRFKEKQIELIIEEPVRALLTDAGFNPAYGARPLRRAITKYLEDVLVEKCLSEVLYPNTRLYVRRKKSREKINEYENKIEIEVDYANSDLDSLNSNLDDSAV